MLSFWGGCTEVKLRGANNGSTHGFIKFFFSGRHVFFSKYIHLKSNIKLNYKKVKTFSHLFLGVPIILELTVYVPP